jgi:hypothetical protein
LFLREDLSSLECATFKQEHLTLSLDDLIAFVTLGDSISRWLGVARELPYQSIYLYKKRPVVET